jgi:N-acetylglucosamine kinase-like BadF-type ATPase
MRVLGIDAGGTKTVCQLATDRGEVLVETRGPGANLALAGEADVERTLRDVIGRALEGQPDAPVAICLGMASVDRPAEALVAHAILQRISERAKFLIVNDALIALEAGAPGEPGVVLIAGTGSIAYGRDDQGRAARAGGWGYVLGDEGSGYWLGRQALRAVMRAADGRGQATRLTALVKAHYRIARSQDLVQQIYGGGADPTAIAALSSLVQEAATDADAFAAHLIETSAGDLTGLALSVTSQLGLDSCAVVLAGGVFKAVPLLQTAVAAGVGRVMPRARVQPLEVEPALGAVRLAIARAQGRVVLPRYIESAS